MRILILPLVIVLLVFSYINTSAQSGANCGTDPATGAINIPLDGNCANYSTSGTSGNVTAAGACGYATTGQVTWFRFTATTACPKLTFTVAGGVQTEVALFTNCATQVTSATTCMPNGTGIWLPSGSTITVGTTYYLRVYTNTVTAGTNINICTSPTQALLDGSCTSVATTLVRGTTNNSPACSYLSNSSGRAETWVRFRPSSATACVTFGISNNSFPVTSINTEVDLYTGSPCPTLQSTKSMCFNDGVGVWSPGPGYTWPGWTATTDYYLRIYTEVGFSGIFSSAPKITVCGTEASPANDACSGATQIDQVAVTDNNVCDHGNPGEIMPNQSSGGTSATPNSQWICAAILHNTAWYYFRIQNGSTTTTVNINNINCDQYNTNNAGQIQVGLLTGGCTAGTIKKESSSQTGSPNCYQGSGPNVSLTIPANRYANGTVVYMAIDGYSGSNCKYTLTTANAIPIPVRLGRLLIFKDISSNIVHWETFSEMNNDHFEIERSSDGIIFESIGRVAGAGNSDVKLNYKFVDKAPIVVGYYRLKQVDYDGKTDYSNIIIVRRDNMRTMLDVSFANPVHGSSFVNINTGRKGVVKFQVIDVAGKTLATQLVQCAEGNNTALMEFSKLPAGQYYLVVIQDDKRLIKPFIKQ